MQLVIRLRLSPGRVRRRAGQLRQGFMLPAFRQVMQRVVHRHADQAGTQHQRHDVHAAKQRHAGHRTKQHADHNRNKGQQHAPASEGQ
ncbi:hypothetical protein F2S75_01340, partial [Pseudomonas syringae pv. actinidiae]|nr:hypothetical protein [Pseudomonas syringae pv. actinidiae]